MLMAETSGREKYAPAWAFYDSAEFALEATIRDYYDKGDDRLKAQDAQKRLAGLTGR